MEFILTVQALVVRYVCVKASGACIGNACLHSLAPPSLHSAPAAPNAIQNCVDRPYFTVGFLAVSG